MVKSQNNLFTFVEPAAAAAGFGGCWRALDLDDASDAQDRADPSDFKRCRESFMDSGQAASDGKQLILSSPTNTRVRVFPLPPRNGGCPQLAARSGSISRDDADGESGRLRSRDHGLTTTAVPP
mmetsp:Transcript_4319/g.9709  ORF Transcript_4319/g.9709 Transcript_4319/m.9709 type:complete len:124 (+) Transcript_4319:570-941(+)